MLLRHSPSLERAIPPALEGPLQISAKENDALPPLIISLKSYNHHYYTKNHLFLEETPFFELIPLIPLNPIKRLTHFKVQSISLIIPVMNP